jgi:hypothetical protein
MDFQHFFGYPVGFDWSELISLGFRKTTSVINVENE